MLHCNVDVRTRLSALGSEPLEHSGYQLKTQRKGFPERVVAMSFDQLCLCKISALHSTRCTFRRFSSTKSFFSTTVFRSIFKKLHLGKSVEREFIYANVFGAVRRISACNTQQQRAISETLGFVELRFHCCAPPRNTHTMLNCFLTATDILHKNRHVIFLLDSELRFWGCRTKWSSRALILYREAPVWASFVWICQFAASGALRRFSEISFLNHGMYASNPCWRSCFCFQ